MSINGQGHSLSLVKGQSDFKVKCLTFGLYTQVSDSGPLGPLVYFRRNSQFPSDTYNMVEVQSKVNFWNCTKGMVNCQMSGKSQGIWKCRKGGNPATPLNCLKLQKFVLLYFFAQGK